MGSKIRTGARLMKNAVNTAALSMAKKMPRLKGMVFEVTGECNSRCRHCNIWHSKPTSPPLTLAEIEGVFGDPLIKDLEDLILTGGEPVLRQDIKEVISAAQRLLPKARITLSTNGLLPARVIDVVRSALDASGCITVGVSLDGVGKNHDEIRGVPGNFERVDRLLRELKQLKAVSQDRLSVLVGHTLSHLTAATLEETAQYVGGLGLEVFTQLYEEFSYYGNVGTKLNPGNARMVEAINQLPGSLHNTILLKHLKRDRPVKFRCFSMKSFFLLRHGGDVSPCLRHAKKSAGNVRTETLTRIWQGSGAGEARELVRRCDGCSNTWGTSWSLDAWFPPFTGILARHLLREQFLAKP